MHNLHRPLVLRITAKTPQKNQNQKLTDDIHPAKGRLLRVMTLEWHAFGLVRDIIRRDGRVVGYLLDNKIGTPASVLVRPVTIEESGEIIRRCYYTRITTPMQEVTYSPKTGLRGLFRVVEHGLRTKTFNTTYFFSEPMDSFRVVYCPFNVLWIKQYQHSYHFSQLAY